MKDSLKKFDKKSMLCLDIEFYFRFKNNIDSDRKWLYNNVKE